MLEPCPFHELQLVASLKPATADRCDSSSERLPRVTARGLIEANQSEVVFVKRVAFHELQLVASLKHRSIIDRCV